MVGPCPQDGGIEQASRQTLNALKPIGDDEAPIRLYLYCAQCNVEVEAAHLSRLIIAAVLQRATLCSPW